LEIIGVDIGGTKCAVIGADEKGELQSINRFPTTELNETLDRIFEAVAKLNPGYKPVFGVSCGGPLDSTAGIIQSPPNLPGWDDIPIVKMLTDRFGGKSYLMNDANAGALAEWQFGAARGYKNVLFFTHGTGMGAGIILNGQLYEGTTGDAGEVGHIRLDEDGPVGYGKAGSFEGFCSGGGIVRLAEIKGYKASDIKKGGGLTTKDIAVAAENGDLKALDILALSGFYLGKGLSLLIDILNPEIIVLGSIYLRAGKFLQESMMETLKKETLARSLAACKIVAVGLGEEIGNYAAIAVATYRKKITENI
jgi:glucokinase